MKKLIRWLYWTFAHDGDKWQNRLVLYHLPHLLNFEANTPGTVLLAQLNKMSGKLEHVAEVNFSKVPKEMP